MLIQDGPVLPSDSPICCPPYVTAQSYLICAEASAMLLCCLHNLSSFKHFDKLYSAIIPSRTLNTMFKFYVKSQSVPINCSKLLIFINSYFIKSLII